MKTDETLKAKSKRGQNGADRWLKVDGDPTVPPGELGKIHNFLTRNDQGRQLNRDELIERIESYIRSRMTIEVSEDGKESIKWILPPTKSGLALAVGVSTRTLERYARGMREGDFYKNEGSVVNPDDFPIVRRAFQIIEDFHESRLPSNSIGSIFWLKASENGGWSDNSNRTELQLTVNQESEVDRQALIDKYQGSEMPKLPDMDETDNYTE